MTEPSKVIHVRNVGHEISEVCYSFKSNDLYIYICLESFPYVEHFSVAYTHI